LINALVTPLNMNLLELFGKVSGFHYNNEQKSNVYPIQCSEDDPMVVHNLLPCERSDFPCRYLGIPLSLRKLTKEQLQPIIDRIVDRLPSWKADLVTKAVEKLWCNATCAHKHDCLLSNDH
jgi:hypothetical protein